MISVPVGMITSPEDRPGHSRGAPDASRTLHVPNMLKFFVFLHSEEFLSKLSEIFHMLVRDVQNVCISLGNRDGWVHNVLQTAAAATLCARDGPESS